MIYKKKIINIYKDKMNVYEREEIQQTITKKLI